MTDTIVFIHGMYMNGASWDQWLDRANGADFKGLAPSWPFHDGDPSALRQSLDPRLGALTLGDVVEHHEQLLDGLEEPPYLIGHSIGGLVVQKLINQGYGKAGVAISTAPARGVVTGDAHFLRANFPHVNPLAGNRPIRMTKDRFHYTFCNTMTRAESDTAFDKWVVPESRNVPRSTLLSQGAVDFKRQHAPLLFIAAETDHLTPMTVVRRNARRYRPESGVVVFETMPGRSHLICNQQGWESVANRAFEFLRSTALGTI